MPWCWWSKRKVWECVVSFLFFYIPPFPFTDLQYQRVPIPEPGDEEVQIRVITCAICRTDLHVRDGELQHPKLPLVQVRFRIFVQQSRVGSSSGRNDHKTRPRRHKVSRWRSRWCPMARLDLQQVRILSSWFAR